MADAEGSEKVADCVPVDLPGRGTRSGARGEPSGHGTVSPLQGRRPAQSLSTTSGLVGSGSLRDAVAELEERRARNVSTHPVRLREVDSPPQRQTARERIARLLDDDTFVELNAFARHRATGFGMEDKRPDTDGVVTGWGLIDGRKVFVYAHDFRIFGGALGEVFASKVRQVMDLAEASGAPVIGLNDGGGARIQEGIRALAGFGGIFRRNVQS